MNSSGTILITGAAGNLGSAVTEKFLSLNFKVIACIHGDNPFSPNENLVVEQLNVFDETASKSFVERIVTEHNAIDCAALLVGGFAMGKVEDMNDDSFQKMIQLNFLSASHMFTPLMKHMLQMKNGRIVLAGAQSVMNPHAGKNMSAYVLSKSLLFKASELLNEAGKNFNVKSGVLAPSTIDTPENRSAMPSADFSKWNKPSDLAELISDFCTKKAESAILSL